MVDAREPLLDELLVLRCREGSRDAFGRLVERWQERLWRHAYRLTGRRDVAWDVLQEAWISIAGGIARLEDPQRFGRWAYTIVTRRAHDARRRTRPETSLEDAGGEPPGVSEDGDGPVQAVRAALRQIAREQRVLLSLHHIDGFGLAEIAAILGVPEGTVKSRLHDARNKLREILERNER